MGLRRPTALAIGGDISAAPAPQPARNAAGTMCLQRAAGPSVAAEEVLQKTASGRGGTHTRCSACTARRGRAKRADGDICQCDACHGPVASEGAEIGGQKDSRPFWTQGKIGIAT